MTKPDRAEEHGRRRRIGRLAGLAALLLPLLAAACTRGAPAPASVVKIAVEADGIYQVTSDELKAVGFDPSDVRPDGLRLTAGGMPIGFQWVQDGAKQLLRFYGQALGPQAYTTRNVYWLSLAPSFEVAPQMERQASPMIAARPVVPSPAAVQATDVVSATVRAEAQRHYHGQALPAAPNLGHRAESLAGGEDRWIWETIFAPDEIQVMLQAPDPEPLPALLRIGVIGNSSAPVDPDHHLILDFNGMQVGDVTWDGAGRHTITATVSGELIRPGENTLSIRAPHDTGAAADSVLLDWVELSYARRLVASGEVLQWEGDAHGYIIQTSDRPATIWDITDPARPLVVEDHAVADGMIRFGADGERRHFIATTGGMQKPASISPYAGPDLNAWPGGADMIIVTVPAFHAALEPLVTAREAQGLRVAVVDVESVYDHFGYGRAEPEAMRALVRHALAHWEAPAPRFLLLAGDASYDPRGYLEAAEVDLVPTQAVYTSFSGWTGSDVWFALPDDSAEARPALAVGRFPAQTAGQLAEMVEKTLAHERGDRTAAWRKRAVLVADNDEPGYGVAAADFAGALDTHETDMITIGGDGSDARQALLKAIDRGTGLIGYFGHGSVTLWAREKVLDVTDVNRLNNREMQPIIFTATCLSGFFEHPTTPSLGETMLRASNGGAVAALVPSSAALLSDQQVLGRRLAEALASAADPSSGSATLGEAVRQAQARLPGATPGARTVLLTFNLLGDPALPLN